MTKLRLTLLLLLLPLLAPSRAHAQQPIVGQACGAPGINAISTNGSPVVCAGNPPVWTIPGGGGGGVTTVTSIPSSCTFGTSGDVRLTVAPGGSYSCSPAGIYLQSSNYPGTLLASSFGVKGDGNLFKADLTVGLPSVSNAKDLAGNAISFSSADNGKIVQCMSALATGAAAVTMRLNPSTVSGASGSALTASNNALSTQAGATCFMATDDTTNLRNAYNAAMAPNSGCPTLILPGGKIGIRAAPFINIPATPVCTTKITGQGAGNGSYSAYQDYGTTFIPFNDFDFTSNFLKTMLFVDNTNFGGRFEGFAINSLGMPFSDASNGKTALTGYLGYASNISCFGFTPTSGAGFQSCVSTNTNNIWTNLNIQASSACLTVSSVSGSTFINTNIGNCGFYEIALNGATDIEFIGGYHDECVGQGVNTGCIVLTNSQRIRLVGLDTLAAGTNVELQIDGTSEAVCDSSVLGKGGFANTAAVIIAAGGIMRATNCNFLTGTSTTNASIINNGTYFDNGGNRCTSQGGAANNSGGTIPGDCVANGGNAAVAALTHSMTNYVEGVVNLAASNIGNWTPDQNITITRIQATNTAGNITCATPLVLKLSNGVVSQDTSLTLTSGQASWDSGVISKRMISGTQIILSQTAAGVCAVPPINLNISILWQSGSGS